MNSALSGPQNQSGPFAEDTNPLPFPETTPTFFRHLLTCHCIKYAIPAVSWLRHFSYPHACYTPRTSRLPRSNRLSNFCYVCFWRDSPQWARASSFTKFLDHTQRRTTVCRTPLDELSACRRDLYVTTHNIHNRQTSIPPAGFEPTISSRPAAADLPLRSCGHWDLQ